MSEKDIVLESLKERKEYLEDKQVKNRAALIEAEETLSTISKVVRNVHNELADINRRIDKIDFNNKEPEVSAHAIVRYLERVKGFPIDEVKKEILTDNVKKTINTIHSGKVPLENKVMLIVKNKIIVTIIDEDGDKEK